MTEALSFILIAAFYLIVGRLLYKHRWPDGFIEPPDDDAELERTRRIGRRRVQPVPWRRGREEP